MGEIFCRTVCKRPAVRSSAPLRYEAGVVRCAAHFHSAQAATSAHDFRPGTAAIHGSAAALVTITTESENAIYELFPAPRSEHSTLDLSICPVFFTGVNVDDASKDFSTSPAFLITSGFDDPCHRAFSTFPAAGADVPTTVGRASAVVTSAVQGATEVTSAGASVFTVCDSEATLPPCSPDIAPAVLPRPPLSKSATQTVPMVLLSIPSVTQKPPWRPVIPMLRLLLFLVHRRVHRLLKLSP